MTPKRRRYTMQVLPLVPSRIWKREGKRMKRFAKTIALSTTIVIVALATSAHAQGSWTTKAPLPSQRSAPGVGVVNGLLYVVGGEQQNDCTFTNTNFAYDPSADSWTSKASMPTRHRYPSVAVAGGLMYVMGGDI
jgi:N-acetylneuraminic acid mutarotase